MADAAIADGKGSGKRHDIECRRQIIWRWRGMRLLAHGADRQYSNSPVRQRMNMASAGNRFGPSCRWKGQQSRQAQPAFETAPECGNSLNSRFQRIERPVDEIE